MKWRFPGGRIAESVDPDSSEGAIVQNATSRKVQIKKRLSDNGDEFRGELSETQDQGCNKKSTEDLQNLQLVELWIFHTK